MAGWFCDWLLPCLHGLYSGQICSDSSGLSWCQDCRLIDSQLNFHIIWQYRFIIVGWWWDIDCGSYLEYTVISLIPDSQMAQVTGMAIGHGSGVSRTSRHRCYSLQSQCSALIYWLKSLSAWDLQWYPLSVWEIQCQFSAVPGVFSAAGLLTDCSTMCYSMNDLYDWLSFADSLCGE